MKVLVIDDNESVRQVLSMVLEMSGYEVATANSGAEGIKAFRENGGFALVVTDNDMPPGINGQQVIAEIQKLKPSQPMVLFTANDDLVDWFEENPSSFLVLRKPATMEEILATVAAAINN